MLKQKERPFDFLNAKSFPIATQISETNKKQWLFYITLKKKKQILHFSWKMTLA